jgi:hypothetical protein
MEPVFAAWSILVAEDPEEAALDAPLPDDRFDQFAAAYGAPVPPELRALYEISSGGIELLDGSIRINPWPPLPATSYGIQETAGPLPAQLQVFGSNGGDDAWAFWLTALPGHPCPVLVLQDHDAEGIVFASGSIASFLRLETAACLLLDERTDTATRAADALGVPPRLRAGGLGEDALLDDLAKWADPVHGFHGYYGGHEPLPPGGLTSLQNDLG